MEFERKRTHPRLLLLGLHNHSNLRRPISPHGRSWKATLSRHLWNSSSYDSDPNNSPKRSYPVGDRSDPERCFGGFVFPALNELMSYWAPPLERTKLIAIWNSGNHIGTFLTMTLCGLISQFMGWQWIFYLSGMTGILWSVVWTWKVYEDPLKDPNITVEERDYIHSSIGKLHRVKVK